MRTVLFFRHFRRMRGGHLKVFHYFRYVRSSPDHEARIAFTPRTTWDDNPWSDHRDAVVDAPAEVDADVLFLAGKDWLRLDAERRSAPPVPVINLIQHVRHGQPGNASYEFLGHPAIRICVTPEVQEAIERTSRVRGPVITIPEAIDVDELPAAPPWAAREVDCVVLAFKEPRLGRAVGARLAGGGHRVRVLERRVPRGEVLDAMARARVSVHVPNRTEGAYLPALEGMALGSLVVCPDCVGNRSFCRDGETCLMPERTEDALVASARQALAASEDELASVLAAGRREAESRDLAEERDRFLAVLDAVDELWAGV